MRKNKGICESKCKVSKRYVKLIGIYKVIDF